MKARLFGTEGPDLPYDFVAPNDPYFDGFTTMKPLKVRIAESIGLVAMSFGKVGLWRTDGSPVLFDPPEIIDVDLLPEAGRILAVGGKGGNAPWLAFLDPSSLQATTRVSLKPHPGCALDAVVAHEKKGLVMVVWRGQSEFGYDVHRLPSLEPVPKLTFRTDGGEPSAPGFSSDGSYLVSTFAFRDGWWLDDASRDDYLTGQSLGGTFLVGYVRVDGLDSGVERTIDVKASVPAGYRPDDVDEYLQNRIWGPYDAGPEQFSIRLPGGVFHPIRYDEKAETVVVALEASWAAKPVDRSATPPPGPRITIPAPKLKPDTSPKKLDAELEKLGTALPAAAARNPMAIRPKYINLLGYACDAYGHGRLEDARRLLEAALEVRAAPYIASPHEGKVSLRIAGTTVETAGRPLDGFVTNNTEWLNAFHLGLVFRRSDILDALAAFPSETVPIKPHNRYSQAHVAFARSVLKGDEAWRGLASEVDGLYREVSQEPLTALRVAPSWHAFLCLRAVARQDAAEYELQLKRILETFIELYNHEDIGSPFNRLCVPALGMAAYGADRGHPVRIDCDYMPLWLVFPNP